MFMLMASILQILGTWNLWFITSFDLKTKVRVKYDLTKRLATCVILSFVSISKLL